MEERAFATLMTLQKHIQSLKLLPRTGWLQRGLTPVESIAEHCFGVATLALLIGDCYPELDRAKLLAMALVHDLGEALTGDLPASASRLFGKAAKRQAERTALLELLGELPQSANYLQLWEEYSAGTTPEARLVKALDRLEMLSQALAYERAGSRGLNEFWEERTSDSEFPLVQALSDALFAEHQALINPSISHVDTLKAYSTEQHA